MQSNAMQDLKRAVASLTRAKGVYVKDRNRVPHHPLKAPALQVEPKASVRKTAGGHYECLIDGKHLCAADGSPRHHAPHSTTNQAWLCLALHLIACDEALERSACKEHEAAEASK